MALLQDLIQQIDDPALKERIAAGGESRRA